MPKVVVKGVIARPGTYQYSWGKETKTAAELKAAVDRQPSIILTMGHPKGEVTQKDIIGRVDQYWNETEQGPDGTFSFYDEEYWERIPEAIRHKIVNDIPTEISADFSVDEVAEDGQKGILYHHIALLREDENPICPLGVCGINVRRESKGTMTKRRLEQETTIGGNEDATESEDPKILQSEESSDVDDLRTEIVALKSQIAELTAATVREPEAVKEPTPEEPAAETVDEVAPVPETIIPAGVKPSKPWKVTDSGDIEIVHQPKKSV